MRAIFHHRCKKFLKRLRDRSAIDLLKKHIDEIIRDPFEGQLLEQPFRKYEVRKKSFDYKGNSYRIAYTVSKEKNEVIFLVIDSRENFYEKLKNAMK
jgi:mRNA-degrading endonuclease RelE of RelBE toxin-antitoxin system